jgi:hypothetical protein
VLWLAEISKFLFSETNELTEPKLYMNDHWKVLYQVTVFLCQSEIQSCSGGHLGFPIDIENRNLVKNFPMINHLQFGFSQFISFREEDLWNFSQSEHKKLQIWLKPNCTWMFIEWSSTKFTFFVPIWNSKWRLRQNLV